jgi:hypothetical protein
MGSVTTYVYDCQSRLREIHDPAFPITTVVYDCHGKQLSPPPSQRPRQQPEPPRA